MRPDTHVKDVRRVRTWLPGWLLTIIAIFAAPVAAGLWVLRLLHSSNYPHLRAKDWAVGALIVFVWSFGYTSRAFPLEPAFDPMIHLAVGLIMIVISVREDYGIDKRAESYARLLQAHERVSLSRLAACGQSNSIRLLNELEYMAVARMLPPCSIQVEEHQVWLQREPDGTLCAVQNKKDRAARRGRQSTAVLKAQNGSTTLLVLLIFPVGLVGWVIRFLSNRRYSYLRMEDWRTLGYMAIVTFTLFSLNSYRMGDALGGVLTVYGLAMGVAVALFVLARQQHRKLEGAAIHFEEVLLQRGRVSLRELTGEASMSVEREWRVIHELRYMFYHRLLPPGYVDEEVKVVGLFGEDEGMGRLSAPGSRAESYAGEEENAAATDSSGKASAAGVRAGAAAGVASRQPGESAAPRIQKCQGCGAQRLLHPGEVTECDYCGLGMSYSGEGQASPSPSR